MLYHEENVRQNLRNREGKRVFYLGQGDSLTPSARDWLRRERIEILPARQARPEHYRLENGALFSEKPEQYTHLRGDILVCKTDPVIAFRGAMDTLEAELLLAQQAAREIAPQLGEVLELARQIVRWEVLCEPVQSDTLCGLTQQELRHHSHFPQEHYAQPHFMPEHTDGAALLQINRARCAARAAELAAARAFVGADGCCEREDLLRALNRMSSMLYILMIRLKKARSAPNGAEN